jgi:hypothetical protein
MQSRSLTPSTAFAPAVCLAGVFVGLAIRVWLAAAFQGALNVDNAKVGLMAMHALHGRFYAFFWGQPQLGSLESVVIAPVFAALGVSDFTLALGLLPWFVVFSVALYFITRRCGGASAAAIALLLSAVSSPLVQIHQVTALSGYAANPALGMLLVWLALVLVYDRPAGVSRRLLFVAFGLIAGLAFWNSWLIASYLLTSGLYLLLDDPVLPLRFESLEAAVAFFVGSLPWWVHNLRFGFPSVLLLSAHARGYQNHLEDLAWALSRGVPEIVGIRSAAGVVETLIILTVAFGAFAALGGVTILRRDLFALIRRRPRQASEGTILGVLGVASVAFYVFARPTPFEIDRYLLPLASAALPLIAIAIAAAIRRTPTLGFAVLATVVLYLAVGVVALHRDFEHSFQRDLTRAAGRLGRTLEREGIASGYADRMDAGLVSYLTREHVVLTDYHELDYPRDEIALRNPALILGNGSADTTLRSLDATFSVRRHSGHAVYWPIVYDGVPRAPLSRARWKVSANVASDDADNMLDGDLDTAWSVPTSGTHPELTIDLGREETVSGIYTNVGEWPEDGFHRIAVEASADRTNWELVKEATWDFPVSFRSDGSASVMPDEVQMVLFPPRRARWLRLRLLEAPPERNWSIAELEVFGPGGKDSLFRAPSYADESSFELVERRLRKRERLEPFSDQPLRELETTYRAEGDVASLRMVAQEEARRFRPQVEVNWHFGSLLTLVGYDARKLDERQVEITYYWKAEQKLPSDLAVSVDIERGGSRLNEDYLLGVPGYLSSAWNAGEIVKLTRPVTIPESASPGEYKVKIRVWDPATKRHLRLRSGLWFGSYGPKTLMTSALVRRNPRCHLQAILRIVGRPPVDTLSSYVTVHIPGVGTSRRCSWREVPR